jgi:membrane protein DedA with SNARE-associated domain
VAAIYDVGCFIGAIVAFTIGERLGRKKTIILEWYQYRNRTNLAD